MDHADSLDFVNRLRGGDDVAAKEMYDRYAARLVGLAASRISPKLARKVDAEDIVQSVFRSFFHRVRGGEYQFDRSGDLWRLLAAITINKVLKKSEFFAAGKRAIDAENSVHSAGSVRPVAIDVLCREPTPAEVVATADLINHLLELLRPVERQMLEMRLQGASIEQIATDVQRSERTVRRLMEKLRGELERILNESESESKP